MGHSMGRSQGHSIGPPTAKSTEALQPPPTCQEREHGGSVQHLLSQACYSHHHQLRGDRQAVAQSGRQAGHGQAGHGQASIQRGEVCMFMNTCTTGEISCIV